mmetsp:Transcript_121841/g.272264  ORF Transcript_121841/g.272264 Transcript_121841/m.272264 type:complete len:202 (+) Transcript_121841:571-1176(+)
MPSPSQTATSSARLGVTPNDAGGDAPPPAGRCHVDSAAADGGSSAAAMAAACPVLTRPRGEAAATASGGGFGRRDRAKRPGLLAANWRATNWRRFSMGFRAAAPAAAGAMTGPDIVRGDASVSLAPPTLPLRSEARGGGAGSSATLGASAGAEATAAAATYFRRKGKRAASAAAVATAARPSAWRRRSRTARWMRQAAACF